MELNQGRFVKKIQIQIPIWIWISYWVSSMWKEKISLGVKEITFP